MMAKSAITFFAGCGGACTGLEQAGIPIAWANELDPLIGDIWQLNHQGQLNRQDILKLKIDHIPDADILWASPPCQQFSDANRNKTGGTPQEDTSIAEKLGAVITAKLPEAVVIENVPGYARPSKESQKPTSFEHLLTVLSFCGYNVAWAVLNAADYGVPQSRTRLILVARLRAIASLPPATHSQYQADQLPLFGDRLRPWVSWYDAIEDLLPTLRPTELTAPQLAELERRGLLIDSPQLIDGKANNYGSSITVRAADQPAYTITANAGTRQVSKIILVQLTGYHNSRGPTVKDANDSMFTITASMGNDGKLNKDGMPSFRPPATIAAYSDVRRAEISCLARWQTFPDSFQWGPSKGIAAKAIGNAVPCGLAEAIGRHLLANW